MPIDDEDRSSAREQIAFAGSGVDVLRQRVEVARGRLPLQDDPALYAAMSEREILAERSLAEWIREQRRQQRRRAVEAELAKEERDSKAAARIRRETDRDGRWHRQALAARRRAASPDARLAQLYRRSEWSSRALIAVVALGMCWAGVNVQHNLVPDGAMTNPLFWLSFGVEAMISVPIIVMMLHATTASSWGESVDRGKVIWIELGLLATTVGLNAGPRLANADYGRAAEYAIAPIMVGVVIWLHAWVSTRYASLIAHLPANNAETRTYDNPEHACLPLDPNTPHISGIAHATEVPSSAQDDAETRTPVDLHTSSNPAQDRDFDLDEMCDDSRGAHGNPPDQGADVHEPASRPAPTCAPEPSREQGAHPDPRIAAREKYADVRKRDRPGTSTNLTQAIAATSTGGEKPAMDRFEAIALEMASKGMNARRTVQETAEILSMADSGTAPTTIARQLHMHHTTVTRFWRRRSTSDPFPMTKAARPRRSAGRFRCWNQPESKRLDRRRECHCQQTPVAYATGPRSAGLRAC